MRETYEVVTDVMCCSVVVRGLDHSKFILPLARSHTLRAYIRSCSDWDISSGNVDEVQIIGLRAFGYLDLSPLYGPEATTQAHIRGGSH